CRQATASSMPTTATACRGCCRRAPATAGSAGSTRRRRRSTDRFTGRASVDVRRGEHAQLPAEPGAWIAVQLPLAAGLLQPRGHLAVGLDVHLEIDAGAVPLQLQSA